MKIEEAPRQLKVKRISSAMLVANNKSNAVYIMQHMVIQSSVFQDYSSFSKRYVIQQFLFL